MKNPKKFRSELQNLSKLIVHVLMHKEMKWFYVYQILLSMHRLGILEGKKITLDKLEKDYIIEVPKEKKYR